MNTRPTAALAVQTVSPPSCVLTTRARGGHAKPSRALYVFENAGERVRVRPSSVMQHIVSEMSHWTMLASKSLCCASIRIPALAPCVCPGRRCKHAGFGRQH